jgi:hypothetical protein
MGKVKFQSPRRWTEVLTAFLTPLFQRGLIPPFQREGSRLSDNSKFLSQEGGKGRVRRALPIFHAFPFTPRGALFPSLS